jgi:uncharacterized protein YicC (UPF0701 family)
MSDEIKSIRERVDNISGIIETLTKDFDTFKSAKSEPGNHLNSIPSEELTAVKKRMRETEEQVEDILEKPLPVAELANHIAATTTPKKSHDDFHDDMFFHDPMSEDSFSLKLSRKPFIHLPPLIPFL